MHVVCRMNSMAQRACESDKTDKHHAEEIDDRMQQLRNTSSRLGFYPGVEDFDNTSVPVIPPRCFSHSRLSIRKTLLTSEIVLSSCFGRLIVVTDLQQNFLNSSNDEKVVKIILTKGRIARARPQNCRFHWRGSEPPPNTWFLGPTRVHAPNGISIGSAVFVWLTVVSSRPTTHTQTH